jgi:hypothetical protein
MVIQAVIAGTIAVPFFFRTHISRIVSRIRNRRSEDKSTSDQPLS